MAAIRVKYTSYVTLTRLLGAAIGLALALCACSSTPLASTNRSSKPALGDVLFWRTGSLFTIDADGRNEKLIHKSWDSTGVVQQLLPAGTTLLDFDCGSWSPNGDQILFSARPAPGHRRALYVVNSGGTGLHQVPISPSCGGATSDPPREAAWIPAGRRTGPRSCSVFSRQGSR